MRQITALALCLLATPAAADVAAVLDGQILPGTAAFAGASRDLARAAQADCRAGALHQDWNAAFDAWLAIAHLRMGPQEHSALTIAFWPDSRNSGRRTLARMIEAEDPIGASADSFAEVSAAARGLHALETLLYDADFAGYAPGSYSCTLAQVMTEDLARQAASLETAWREKFAGELRSAGSPENATYLSRAEAERALFTQLHAGIEFNADQRLALPLGSPERPSPARAESWRSGRSQRNVERSMQAIEAQAEALAGHPVPALDEAFAGALFFETAITDPSFQDLADPQARLRLESWQGRIRHVGDVLISALGEAMGIAPGFNALDGD